MKRVESVRAEEGKNILERHVLLQIVVHLTPTEAIRRIFARLGDIDTPIGNSEKINHLTYQTYE